MLVIQPYNIAKKPGNDNIAYVIDHQPAPLSPEILGDFFTDSVYQDQSYNNIEQIIKDHNGKIKTRIGYNKFKSNSQRGAQNRHQLKERIHIGDRNAHQGLRRT